MLFYKRYLIFVVTLTLLSISMKAYNKIEQPIQDDVPITNTSDNIVLFALKTLKDELAKTPVTEKQVESKCNTVNFLIESINKSKREYDLIEYVDENKNNILTFVAAIHLEILNLNLSETIILQSLKIITNIFKIAVLQENKHEVIYWLINNKNSQDENFTFFANKFVFSENILKNEEAIAVQEIISLLLPRKTN